jgi:hypothetical protein
VIPSDVVEVRIVSLSTNLNCCTQAELKDCHLDKA